MKIDLESIQKRKRKKKLWKTIKELKSEKFVKNKTEKLKTNAFNNLKK